VGDDGEVPGPHGGRALPQPAHRTPGFQRRLLRHVLRLLPVPEDRVRELAGWFDEWGEKRFESIEITLLCPFEEPELDHHYRVNAATRPPSVKRGKRRATAVPGQRFHGGHSVPRPATPSSPGWQARRQCGDWTPLSRRHLPSEGRLSGSVLTITSAEAKYP